MLLKSPTHVYFYTIIFFLYVVFGNFFNSQPDFSAQLYYNFRVQTITWHYVTVWLHKFMSFPSLI